jgi:hypothetical protein
VYRAWTASAGDGEALARVLEAHLNEFAEEVLSVSYAVTEEHHVLAVYRPIEPRGDSLEAVAVAEHIVDEAQA